MIDISHVQNLYDDNSVVLTQHFMDRIREREIKLPDIKNAIRNGEIAVAICG